MRERNFRSAHALRRTPDGIGVMGGARARSGRRRALGQNFLIDPTVVERIVAAADLSAQERVLEIGPGRGILTRALIGATAGVVAVEIDESLARSLSETCGEGLEVIASDFLELDLDRLPPSPMPVVANLPYATGTAILERLLGESHRFPRMVVMLQKEVAERVAAVPGSRAYGSLSVLTAMRAQARVLFDVGPDSFRPQPKVDSAVVRLDALHGLPSDIEDPALFVRVVRAAFAQRRKMLRNTMRAAFGDAGTVALSSAGIDGRRRAETVSLEEFALLSRKMPGDA